jgi:hypothetical protein
MKILAQKLPMTIGKFRSISFLTPETKSQNRRYLELSKIHFSTLIQVPRFPGIPGIWPKIFKASWNFENPSGNPPLITKNIQKQSKTFKNIHKRSKTCINNSNLTLPPKTFRKVPICVANYSEIHYSNKERAQKGKAQISHVERARVIPDLPQSLRFHARFMN